METSSALLAFFIVRSLKHSYDDESVARCSAVARKTSQTRSRHTNFERNMKRILSKKKVFALDVVAISRKNKPGTGQYQYKTDNPLFMLANHFTSDKSELLRHTAQRTPCLLFDISPLVN